LFWGRGSIELIARGEAALARLDMCHPRLAKVRA
jgi:hypothetical protein